MTTSYFLPLQIDSTSCIYRHSLGCSWNASSGSFGHSCLKAFQNFCMHPAGSQSLTSKHMDDDNDDEDNVDDIGDNADHGTEEAEEEEEDDR